MADVTGDKLEIDAKAQKNRDRLLKEDENILNFVTIFVASGIADGQETSSM
jgi:hypothetical protein